MISPTILGLAWKTSCRRVFFKFVNFLFLTSPIPLKENLFCMLAFSTAGVFLHVHILLFVGTTGLPDENKYVNIDYVKSLREPYNFVQLCESLVLLYKVIYPGRKRGKNIEFENKINIDNK